MLSFELSVMDLVLVIAIVTLLLLYITKISTKCAARSKPSPKREKESDAHIALPRPSSTDSAEVSIKCSHHFGYLKTIPLGSSVPEECYNCSRMMQCLFQGKE